MMSYRSEWGLKGVEKGEYSSANVDWRKMARSKVSLLYTIVDALLEGYGEGSDAPVEMIVQARLGSCGVIL